MEPKQYIWDSFRQLANLHKKEDEMITDYLESFMYMCKRVCNRLMPSEESECVLSVQNHSVAFIVVLGL